MYWPASRSPAGPRPPTPAIIALIFAVLVVGAPLCPSASAQSRFALSPGSHDFGTAALNATIVFDFQLSGVTALTAEGLQAALTGADAGDWYIQNVGGQSGLGCGWPGRNDPTRTAAGAAPWPFPGACDPLTIIFRPKSVGQKSALLEVTDHLGNRVTAVLRGEGIKAGCQPVLVHCNYAGLYSGTIKFKSVDTTTTDDFKSLQETVITVTVIGGKAQCSGSVTEWEIRGYKGVPESEMKGRGDITGPGLVAIEFDFREGAPVYVVTFSCPEPDMVRESRSLAGGTGTSERFPGAPVEWNGGTLVADPQPSSADPDQMPSLTGSFRHDRWDPDNSAGGYTTTSWDLKRR